MKIPIIHGYIDRRILIKSSYFENEAMFPKGSVHFDNALLMTNIEHEWKSMPLARKT